MSKFVVAATVDDKELKTNAKFTYRIVDNSNYTIDKNGGVSAKPGYIPQIGDKFTVEVTYKDRYGYSFSKTKTFTVKI